MTMSYFDPKIYCKQNLKEADLKELEYWKEGFLSVIEDTLDDVGFGIEYSDTLKKIVDEIRADFCEQLKVNLGYFMQDNLISTIEGYEEDEAVNEVESPITFLVCDDKEDEDDD